MKKRIFSVALMFALSLNLSISFADELTSTKEVIETEPVENTEVSTEYIESTEENKQNTNVSENLTSTSTLQGLYGENVDNSIDSNSSLNSYLNSSTRIKRIAGADRIGTSIQISKFTHDKSDKVILASSKNYADALSASSITFGEYPVLLVNNVLTNNLKNEIIRLGAKEAIILGGDNAVNNNVEKSLKSIKSLTKVTRIAGANRYSTSVKISEKSINQNLIVASGSNYPDALAGTILANNKADLVLTPNNKLDTNLEKKLKGFNGDNIKIIGGNAVIKDSVMNNIKKLSKTSNIERIAGANRYDTSVKVAKKTNSKTVILASGQDYPDALAASTLSQKLNAPIILTQNSILSKEVASYVRSASKIIIVGGDAVIAQTVIDGINGENISNEYITWNNINKYSTKIIMSESEIKNYNKNNISKSSYLNDVLNINKLYSKDEITKMINTLSVLPSKPYNKNGVAYSNSTKNSWVNNCNKSAVVTQKNYNFGVVTERTLLRTFPTWDENRTKGGAHDYFAETALNPWDEILVLHQSKDGKWVFGITENYTGWVFKDYIAFSTRDELKKYKNLPKEIVIERQLKIGNKLYDMGSDIPISEKSLLSPTKNSSSKLAPTKISKPSSGTVSGYLPYTEANVIKQALKFKGEKYGWGGSNNGHDCSSLIQDVFKTFGIIMPRNTSQQEYSYVGKTTSLNNMSNSTKQNKIISMGPGTVMYMKGHTMMYIGKNAKGVPMMIHQYAGHYSNGKYVSVLSAQITPLTLGSTGGTTYLTHMRTAVKYTNK
ncbi:cell wall-binding repeat-containing protein [Miniphocaeibacter massiliensis]|uniref:cell wall-binding repeat-containing protein n=1 Tax=Miniphocaeibacter massiliensis TaxID=2041841 RepID=UPI000C1C64B2|nr:cell wall-binding repeat-containing protein [Miniphocaeibacter massiliensis]